MNGTARKMVARKYWEVRALERAKRVDEMEWSERGNEKKDKTETQKIIQSKEENVNSGEQMEQRKRQQKRV